MERVILQFTEPQLAWMRTEAKRLDLSMAEWARRMIDQVRGVPVYEMDPDLTRDLETDRDLMAMPLPDGEGPAF